MLFILSLFHPVVLSGCSSSRYYLIIPLYFDFSLVVRCFLGRYLQLRNMRRVYGIFTFFRFVLHGFA